MYCAKCGKELETGRIVMNRQIFDIVNPHDCELTKDNEKWVSEIKQHTKAVDIPIMVEDKPVTSTAPKSIIESLLNERGDND